MQSNTLVRALPWIARMVARQCGVEVRFNEGASTASIDANRVITLPHVPAGDEVSSSLALGYIVHEAFHAKYTDFDVLDRVKGEAEMQFLGVFEDERIERRGMMAYAGAKLYLHRAWEILYGNGGVRRPTGQPESPVVDVFTFALAHCRASCLQLEPALQDLPRARAVVEQSLGADVAGRLEGIYQRVPQCASTVEAHQLANEVMQCLYEATGQKPPHDQASSPQGDDDATDPNSGDDQQPAPSGDDGDANADPGDGQAPPPGGDSGAAGDDPGDGQQPSSAGDGGASDAAPGDWKDDGQFAEQARQVLNDAAVETDNPLKQALAKAITDAISDDARAGRETQLLGAAHLVDQADDPVSAARAPELLASAAAMTSALRTQIRHLLVSITQEDVRYAPRGRVKPARLWQLRAGRRDVFEATDEGLELDTAVTILLDTSGSMKNKLAVATRATLSIALAVEGLAGLKTEVCSFPGRTEREVNRVKRFDESTQRASGRFAALRVGGCTPLAEALYAVGPELMEQQAGGRLLIVATDGEADNIAAAMLAIGELQMEGVDVIGIGIGCDVSAVFDCSIRLHDESELAAKLFDVLRERFERHAALAA